MIAGPALVNDPELVFLDEPTSGLDPLGRLLVRDLIRDLRARGTTVFLNSHLLGEIEVTCDRVAFVKHGRVVHEMSLIDARARLEVELKIDPVEPTLIQGLHAFGTHVTRENGFVRLQIDREESLPALARWLVDSGVRLYGIQSRPKSLEQWFVDVMGDDQRPG